MATTVGIRELPASAVTEAVARLCVEANYYLPEDVIATLRRAREEEPSPQAREVLDRLIENASLAAQEQMPLCQDCGTTVVFLEVGQDLHLTGGDLSAAVNEGVRRGYKEGYLRKSIVAHPIHAPKNTGDNTPAALHTEIVPGDRLKITVLPKGGGCENVSALGMLTPAQGVQGIIDFVVRTVEEGGPNPCPPVIVGVGVGGTADRCLLHAKKALLRRVGEPHPEPEVAALEKELLRRINALGIGPMGYGGRTTALAVHIEEGPRHIAMFPVAVNTQCHSARLKSAVL